MLIGIIVCAYAQTIKFSTNFVLPSPSFPEQDMIAKRESAASQVGVIQKSSRLGLLICLLSGLFSPMLNYSLDFGQNIIQNFQGLGVGDFASTTAVWALCLGLGAVIVNISICCYFLTVRRNWWIFVTAHRYRRRNLCWSVMMGVIWMIQIYLYGYAVSLMPSTIATSTAWPILMSSTILGANGWGILLHEWDCTSSRSKFMMGIGIFGLIIALILNAIASVL